MAKTSDAIKILNNKIRTDPEMEAMVAEASINAEVAQLIFDILPPLNPAIIAGDS
ncbi:MULTISPECIES: hypothetical protein [unclassified Moorena]|uniref:hypothetical protein n=1 Tax=unclassified Moorena TaxID=2683338 RepID=UPI00257A4F93|nr:MULTISPECIES: hypothetical protein [unclassified Moorena]